MHSVLTYTITRSETAMKRKLIAFTTCLSLLFSVIFVANVTAHTVKLADSTSGLFDKSRGDWFAQGHYPTTTSGQSCVIRSAMASSSGRINGATSGSTCPTPPVMSRARWTLSAS